MVSLWAPVLLLLTATHLTSQQQPAAISFQINSMPIANNSLLPITAITTNPLTTLQCLSNRSDCCDSDTNGFAGIGDWTLPSGNTLTRQVNTPTEVDFYRERYPGGIDLFRRNNATSPQGVYECEIPRSPSQGGGVDAIYVGLYAEGNGKRANMIMIAAYCTSKMLIKMAIDPLTRLRGIGHTPWSQVQIEVP